MNQNLGKMFRGDAKTVQFVLDGSKLPPEGVAGFEMWFTAKRQVSDGDAQAQWQKHATPSNPGAFRIQKPGDPGTTPPTDAVVLCDIEPADTRTLPDYDVVLEWDFQVKDANGKPTTSARGTITVKPDITRAE